MIWLAVLFVASGMFCLGYHFGRSVDGFSDEMAQWASLQEVLRGWTTNPDPAPHDTLKGGSRGSGHEAAPNAHSHVAASNPPRGRVR